MDDTTRHRPGACLTGFTLALLYLSYEYSCDPTVRAGWARIINTTIRIRWFEHGIPSIVE